MGGLLRKPAHLLDERAALHLMHGPHTPREETRMKRTLVLALAVLTAVCLFRASNLLNSAHAQNGNGQANGHVHHINDDGADADDKGDDNSKDSTAAPELNPYGLP